MLNARLVNCFDARPPVVERIVHLQLFFLEETMMQAAVSLQSSFLFSVRKMSRSYLELDDQFVILIYGYLFMTKCEIILIFNLFPL